MQKIFRGLFLAGIFYFCIFGRLFAADVPQATGWVNDFANVISPEYEDKLNSLISGLEAETSSEIAVVTVNSIAPYDEKEYARLLFDSWKPGKKGKDNGVLVLLAIKERAWRIDTGYGIEGVLPDSACGRIGRDYMVPYFKEGKYGEGLYQGVLGIYQVLNPQGYGAQEQVVDHQPGLPVFVFLLIFIVVLIFLAIESLFRPHHNRGYYSRDYWGSDGGGSGGFGGGFGGFGGGGGGGGGAGGRF